MEKKKPAQIVGIISPPYQDIALGGGDAERRYNRLEKEGLIGKIKFSTRNSPGNQNVFNERYSGNKKNVGNLRVGGRNKRRQH